MAQRDRGYTTRVARLTATARRMRMTIDEARYQAQSVGIENLDTERCVQIRHGFTDPQDAPATDQEMAQSERLGRKHAGIGDEL